MNTDTTKAPASTTAKRATRTAAQPAATDEVKKTTVTLTFEPKDADLYKKIVADAEEDERSPSGLLLRFIRKNYNATDSVD